MSGNGSGALWIIDPSVSHAEDEGTAEIVGDWAGPLRLFRPVLRPGDGPGPETGYDAAGIVLMGSAASVHDGASWMRALAAWLGPLLDGRVRRPLLGICYGHQLVAHLAGGGVDYLEAGRTKRVGVERTRLDGGRLLPGRHTLQVVVSHREQVSRCPPGYRVVARRPGAEFDGLEHPELPVYTFQFHPEARLEFARRAGIPPGEITAGLRRDSSRLLRAFRGSLTGG